MAQETAPDELRELAIRLVLDAKVDPGLRQGRVQRSGRARWRRAVAAHAAADLGAEAFGAVGSPCDRAGSVTVMLPARYDVALLPGTQEINSTSSGGPNAGNVIPRADHQRRGDLRSPGR